MRESIPIPMQQSAAGDVRLRVGEIDRVVEQRRVEPAVRDGDALPRRSLPASGRSHLADGERRLGIQVRELVIEFRERRDHAELVPQLAAETESLEVPRHVLPEVREAVPFATTLGEQLTVPTLGEVMAMVRRHGELLAASRGERYGLTDLRKHMAWYFKGFGLGGELRYELGMVSSFAELDDKFSHLDADTPFPVGEVGTPRGRQGSPRERVTVPYGWLDSTLLLSLIHISEPTRQAE